jgi:transcriptional regulator GlxA family with amidase domain
MTRAALVPAAPGTRVVAARLRPGAARRLLGVPAAELTDATRPLLELWPEADALLDAAAAPDALARLTDALARRAARSAPPPLSVRGAIAALERADGALRVDELAPTIGVTRQALARAFAEHVGVSPKLFARVVRMRRALARVDAARRVGWSRVALDAGYHDQAHLTRELRALTGRTPGQWSGGADPG